MSHKNQLNSCNYSTGHLPYKTLLHLYHIDEEGITAMHISYISPLSGWYLAQARPDLTAKDPTHTRLEQRKVVETSSSAWKADVLAVVRPPHENPAYKTLLHHHWRAGNNSGNQRRSINGTQPFYDRGATGETQTRKPFGVYP